MEQDLASLKFAVDSSQAVAGATNLDLLVAASGRAAKAQAEQAASVKALQQQMATLLTIQQSQTQSLTTMTAAYQQAQQQQSLFLRGLESMGGALYQLSAIPTVIKTVEGGYKGLNDALNETKRLFTGDYYSKAADDMRRVANLARDMAFAIGSSAAQVREFSFATEKASLSGGTQLSIQNRMAAARTENSNGAVNIRAGISALGIDAAGARNEVDLLDQIIKRMNLLADGRNKMAIATQVFGKADSEVAALLANGIRNVSETQRQAEQQRSMFYARENERRGEIERRERSRLSDQRRLGDQAELTDWVAARAYQRTGETFNQWGDYFYDALAGDGSATRPGIRQTLQNITGSTIEFARSGFANLAKSRQERMDQRAWYNPARLVDSAIIASSEWAVNRINTTNPMDLSGPEEREPPPLTSGQIAEQLAIRDRNQSTDPRFYTRSARERLSGAAGDLATYQIAGYGSSLEANRTGAGVAQLTIMARREEVAEMERLFAKETLLYSDNADKVYEIQKERYAKLSAAAKEYGDQALTQMAAQAEMQLEIARRAAAQSAIAEQRAIARSELGAFSTVTGLLRAEDSGLVAGGRLTQSEAGARGLQYENYSLDMQIDAINRQLNSGNIDPTSAQYRDMVRERDQMLLRRQLAPTIFNQQMAAAGAGMVFSARQAQGMAERATGRADMSAFDQSVEGDIDAARSQIGGLYREGSEEFNLTFGGVSRAIRGRAAANQEMERRRQIRALRQAEELSVEAVGFAGSVSTERQLEQRLSQRRAQLIEQRGSVAGMMDFAGEAPYMRRTFANEYLAGARSQSTDDSMRLRDERRLLDAEMAGPSQYRAAQGQVVYDRSVADARGAGVSLTDAVRVADMERDRTLSRLDMQSRRGAYMMQAQYNPEVARTRAVADLEDQRSRNPDLVDPQVFEARMAEIERSYNAHMRSMLLASKEFSGGAKAAFSAYAESAGDAAQQAYQFFGKTFSALEESLFQFTKTGKLNAKELFEYIADQLTRMVIQMGVLAPMAQALFALMGGGSPGAGQGSISGPTSGGGMGGGILGMLGSVGLGSIFGGGSKGPGTVTGFGSGSFSLGGLGDLLGSLFGGGGGAIDSGLSYASYGGGFSGGGMFDMGMSMGGDLFMDMGMGSLMDAASMWLPFRKGGAFLGRDVVPFRKGSLMVGPTTFPMAGGKMGMAAEAGPEAIMPLERMSDGRLGVASNEGSGSSAPIIKIENYDQRRSGAPVENDVSKDENGNIIIKTFIRDEVRAAMKEGAMDREYQTNFALQRQPTSR